jgi:DNA mismatch repair protein MutL
VRAIASGSQAGEIASDGARAISSGPQAGEIASGGDPGAGLLQVHNSYLVTSDDDALLIIDQHALHERILYEEFAARLSAGRLDGQRLLIPPTITVSPSAAAAIQERADLLDKLGFEVAPFGPSALAVHRFPSLLSARGVDAGAFLRELAERLVDQPGLTGEALLEELLAMMACKAAVKAGDPLTAPEMAALLARARQAEKPSACPHGRPTTIRLPFSDLEKQFHRT